MVVCGGYEKNLLLIKKREKIGKKRKTTKEDEKIYFFIFKYSKSKYSKKFNFFHIYFSNYKISFY